MPRLITVLFFTLTLYYPATYSNERVICPISHQTLVLGIIGTAATAIMAKTAIDIYFDYFWPTNRMITYYEKQFNTIHHSIESHTTTYTNHTQLSSTELKKHICSQTTHYPFLHYYGQLNRTLRELNTHTNSITKALQRIELRIQTLNKQNNVQTNDTLIQLLTKLITKSKQLKKRLKKASTFISALQNRVTLFSEYQKEDKMRTMEKEQQERDDRESSSEYQQEKELYLEKENPADLTSCDTEYYTVGI